MLVHIQMALRLSMSEGASHDVNNVVHSGGLGWNWPCMLIRASHAIRFAHAIWQQAGQRARQTHTESAADVPRGALPVPLQGFVHSPVVVQVVTYRCWLGHQAAAVAAECLQRQCQQTFVGAAHGWLAWLQLGPVLWVVMAFRIRWAVMRQGCSSQCWAPAQKVPLWHAALAV